MSTRARQFEARVLRREQLSDHLVRLVLGGPGMDGFSSTGIADEWIGLVVPGQFQSRYYTVRRWTGTELTLDVVMHEQGLVTEWAASASPGGAEGSDCVGDTVVITEPGGSYDPPAEAGWLLLIGDLTALPAMARISEETQISRVKIIAEVPDDLGTYLPSSAPVTWLRPPAHGESALAAAVEELPWPEGEGYFWMAGESSQMRAIRKHLMRVRKLKSSDYDVMGYWRGGARRQPRAVDPGPIYRDGKAAGKTDGQIWADYDAAGEHGQGE